MKSKAAFIILFAVLLSLLSPVTAVAAEKANPSGAYIKYTVDIKKPDGETLAYNFFNIKQIDYIIEAGDMLEYDVYLTGETEEAGWGAVDGNATTPSGNLRDTGTSDTDGAAIHTGNDISFSAYETWYRRVLEIGENDNCIGSTIRQFQIAMHPASDEPEYQGVVLYDNIVITNNGEVKLVIFQDESDWNPDQVKLNHQKDCKATVEMLVFTAEEEQAFKDAETEKIRLAEEKEAAKIAAEIERQSSIEQSSIDAELEAELMKVAAEQEAENITETAPDITIPPAADDDGGGMPVPLIIAISAGVIAGIAVIIIINRKKSK